MTPEEARDTGQDDENESYFIIMQSSKWQNILDADKWKGCAPPVNYIVLSNKAKINFQVVDLNWTQAEIKRNNAAG